MQSIRYHSIEVIRLPGHPLIRLMSVYFYYVDGLLIDTGPSGSRRFSLPFLRSRSIEQVALTHVHEDHSGMASWIDRKYRVPIYLHEGKIPEAKKAAEVSFLRKFFSGKRLAFNAQPYPSVIATTAGYRFYPLYTPGHTPDHVCLYEPDRGWLFSGDLYVTPYPKDFLQDEDVDEWIDSLNLLLRLDIRTLFCGHSGVVEKGKEMLLRKRDYLEEMRDKVRQLARRGYEPKEIVRMLFPEKSRLERLSFGMFSRLNFVLSCLKHNQLRRKGNESNECQS